jgi:hypothetical protein
MYAIRNTIICPNKDLPGVQEKAAKVRIDFNERRRTIRKKRKGSDDTTGSKKEKSDKRVATIADIKAMLSQHQSPSKHSHFVLATSINIDTSHHLKDDNDKFLTKFHKAMTSPHILYLDPISTCIKNMDTLSIMGPDDAVNQLCNTVLAFAADNIKPPLPIQFDSNLPHINFDIGIDADKCFKINIAYNTCAVLNVGYAGYVVQFFKCSICL